MGYNAEIIAVGTELLLGQIVNTNAQFLAQGLADIGVNVYFQTVVGDNVTRLNEAISIAKNRADLILFTGGLGPTQDDLTRECVAAFCSRSLVIHRPSLLSIENFFSQRGKPMVESNSKQALMIEGADALINEVGMAVGSAFVEDDTAFVLLPGPPREMKPMFTNYATPWIRSFIGDERPLFSQMLKFAGVGESNLEHGLMDLIEGQSDITIAPYAKEGEVAIRLSVKAMNPDEANLKFAPIVQEIYERYSNNLFSTAGETLEQTVIKQLIEKQATIAVGESMTGGRLGDLITSVAGSSKAFKGGFVTYSNEMKQTLLGVTSHTLEKKGAISREVSIEMAQGASRLTGADYSVSITGNAGPIGDEGKAVGLTYVSVVSSDGESHVRELQLHGDRDTIKQRAVKQALFLLWAVINQKDVE